MSSAVPAVAEENALVSSPDAERALLGGLMLDNEAWDDVADLLAGGDFSREDHRLIYGAIRGLIQDGKHCDNLTICEHLRSREQLDDAGGAGYISNLLVGTPSAANVQTYAGIVRDMSIRRRLARAGQRITGMVLKTGGRAAQELLEEAEQEIFQINEDSHQGDLEDLSLGEGFRAELVDWLRELERSGEAVTGVATGLTDFDNLTAGLQNGDLVIVAGRPSLGKTSLALTIVQSAVLSQDRVSALLFSLEMPKKQLVLRLLSSLGEIDHSNLRIGRIGRNWSKVNSALEHVEGCAVADRRFPVTDAGPDPLPGPARGPCGAARRPAARLDPGRLSAAHRRGVHRAAGHESRHGAGVDFQVAKGAGARAECAGRGAVAAQPGSRTAGYEAGAVVGFARLRRDRTGCRRGGICYAAGRRREKRASRTRPARATGGQAAQRSDRGLRSVFREQVHAVFGISSRVTISTMSGRCRGLSSRISPEFGFRRFDLLSRLGRSGIPHSRYRFQMLTLGVRLIAYASDRRQFGTCPRNDTNCDLAAFRCCKWTTLRAQTYGPTFRVKAPSQLALEPLQPAILALSRKVYLSGQERRAVIVRVDHHALDFSHALMRCDLCRRGVVTVEPLDFERPLVASHLNEIDVRLRYHNQRVGVAVGRKVPYPQVLVSLDSVYYKTPLLLGLRIGLKAENQ